MTPLSAFQGPWPAISELLDEALHLPIAARDAWLATLTGDRAVHRDALASLLATQAQIDTKDFLAELPCLPEESFPAAADRAGEPAPEGLVAGLLVGPYRLIEEIGRGGMGTVWLAERADGLGKRRVALKLPQAVWGDELAERFARERDILATLAHANIARLYDVGMDSLGRPYLAMEYVEGETIDAYCRTRELPLRGRIELLLQVMAAVTHAHARLVVHRDLKPPNILVTQEGQVRLLDFGIAKLLQADSSRETALTELGGRVLTVDYASPEQIRGEPLGTASDVYSMAVVAYEVLSGGRPYRLKRGSAAALEEAIASSEAPPASASATDPRIARQLSGDLDAVLNKALKKAVDERYPTMEAFAHDLRRWRDGEPVQARPDTASYRVRKFIGRHRFQVASAAAVVLALAVGVTLALWQAREASLQAEQARTEARTAEAVRGFLESIFQTNTGDQVDPASASLTTARQLLDRGADRIDVALKDAPQARYRLLGILADLYEGMALLDKAVELQHHRMELARQHMGPQSLEYAEALAGSAQSLALLDRREESTAAVHEAASILDRMGDFRSATRFRIDYAAALNLERSDESLGLAAAGRAVNNARDRAAHADLVRALLVQGEIAQSAHRLPLARDGAREAIRLIEADPSVGANGLADQYLVLADAQSGLGELDDAEASYRKSLETARQRNQAAPIVLHAAAGRYGSFLRAHGRYRDSIEILRPSYLWALGHPSGAGVAPPTIVAEYGRALVAYGRVNEGLAVFDELLAMRTGVEQLADLVGPIWMFKAQGLLQLERWDKAHAALVRAQVISQKGALPHSPQFQAAWRQWQVSQGHAGEALQGFEAWRATRNKGGGTLQSDSPRVIAESAWLHLRAGQRDTAGEQAQLALDKIAGDPWKAQWVDAEALATAVAGQALLQQGRLDAAREMLMRSVRIHEAVYDPQDSPKVAEVKRLWADANRRLGVSRQVKP